jgi:hypothetical protein
LAARPDPCRRHQRSPPADPAELKLGVVTAIIGAPFLFGLIYRLREEEA